MRKCLWTLFLMTDLLLGVYFGFSAGLKKLDHEIRDDYFFGGIKYIHMFMGTSIVGNKFENTGPHGIFLELPNRKGEKP